ncbi:hypothetical protein HXX76_011584 [Chlamydomonas incerta]|uniref:Protein kinase domain-containing protein n=1 Tax=Chlamydomonas incerta TaxID=51695 RepID=A0A835SXS3_CHLIN|nr:hypothetical protein HXX76_011584 [Chlamydomonas incerta]|eukprot:KAG2428465.1 hypothetical protein HXX76_011584 [Chlamydomonas incerta]
MLMSDVCYPQRLWLQNFQGLSRSPAYPGTNALVPVTPQAGCVNSTEVPRPRRCFPETGLIVDVAVEATELSPLGGAPVPSNYLVRGMNMSIACQAFVAEECIQQYTLPGCLQLVLNARKAAAAAEAHGEVSPGALDASGSLLWGQQPPAASAGPPASGDAVSRTPLWLPLVGGILGGTVVVLAMGFGAAYFRGWRRVGDTKGLQGSGPQQRVVRGNGACDEPAPVIVVRDGSSGNMQQSAADGARCDGGAGVDGGGGQPQGSERSRWHGLGFTRSSQQKSSAATAFATFPEPGSAVMTDTAAGGCGCGGSLTTKRSCDPAAQDTLNDDGTGMWSLMEAEALAAAGVVSGGNSAEPTEVAAAMLPDPAAVVLSPLTPARSDLHVIELVGNSQPQLQHAAEAAAGAGKALGPGDDDVGAATVATGADSNNELKLLPGEILGRGACGRVYRGLFRGQLVAVKMIGDVGLLPPAQQQLLLLQPQQPQPQQPQQPQDHQGQPSAPHGQKGLWPTPQQQHGSLPDIPTYVSATDGTDVHETERANARSRGRSALYWRTDALGEDQPSRAGGGRSSRAPACTVGPASGNGARGPASANEAFGSAASRDSAAGLMSLALQRAAWGSRMTEAIVEAPEEGVVPPGGRAAAAPCDSAAAGAWVPWNGLPAAADAAVPSRSGDFDAAGVEEQDEGAATGPHHVATASAPLEQLGGCIDDIGAPAAAGPQEQQQQQAQQLQLRMQQPALSETQEGLVRALQQEVEVLGRCSHPCIVKLLAVCVEPPLLVMELMDTSLDRLQYGGGGGGGGGWPLGEGSGGGWAGGVGLLPLPLVLHIGIEVARGLAYMHPTLVHRDLKPANVLLSNPHSERPVVKIADFGLSRLRNTVVITQNPEAGTPAYMAPECYDLNNFMISHKVDVFALGVMMAEMLVGRRPWHGRSIVEIATATSWGGRRPYDLARDVQAAAARAAAAEAEAGQGRGQGHEQQRRVQPRCPAKLLKLIGAMWDQDPARRPAAAEVAKMLTVMQQQQAERLTLQAEHSRYGRGSFTAAAVE